jgi:hypothetical protein
MLPLKPGKGADSGSTEQPGPPKALRREIGLGHAELFRLLPRAIGDRTWRVHRDLITITGQEQHVYIKLFPESRRDLGTLKLPVTMLEFSFHGFTPEQVDAFIGCFDLAFRRGGGGG